ncbi:MAG: phosphoribosylaminoimidazolesuccinocarboxamide synthase [Flavobacteriaceae bacterium]|nr:phosphoribosylaminoimidazolesuccinocarboxamide synthase [Flavobacteriaceae bacterium]
MIKLDNQQALLKSHLQLDRIKKIYRGKVRDLYHLENDLLIMIATDRVSAFDRVMDVGIPFKGQVLNQLSVHMLQKSKKIVPNWFLVSPDPNVSIGHYCQPIEVEMVIRNNLIGHVYRLYQSGKRDICGVELPDGLVLYDAFEKPIITPTTKAKQGHDVDISKNEIIENGIVSLSDYELMEKYTYKLFEFGSQMALENGLILMDTKYEFGKMQTGDIVLIDEVHTADSSRYTYAHSLENKNKIPSQVKHLSKEFFRQWLISKGYRGDEHQTIPSIDFNVQNQLSERYIQLYHTLTSQKFVPSSTQDVNGRIQEKMDQFLISYFQ